jgi:hypothetical protein
LVVGQKFKLKTSNLNANTFTPQSSNLRPNTSSPSKLNPLSIDISKNYCRVGIRPAFDRIFGRYLIYLCPTLPLFGLELHRNVVHDTIFSIPDRVSPHKLPCPHINSLASQVLRGGRRRDRWHHKSVGACFPISICSTSL